MSNNNINIINTTDTINTDDKTTWNNCPTYKVPVNVECSKRNAMCCKCNNVDNCCVKINEKYLSVGYSIFENLNEDIVMYFTDMRPSNLIVGRYICDDCIFELLYDGTLQFDYTYPWYNYQEPPTLENVMGPTYIRGKFNVSKYKPISYDYRKRLFRNGRCASDFDYPGIFKSNIEKIKMNPDLFGEYSRKIAKNL